MNKHQFYHLQVSDVRRLTPDCVELSFEIPQDKKELFQFSPGQYLTLKAFIGGEDIRRSYSICSSPHENRMSVAIKKIPEGRFSGYANHQLKKGDYLDVMPPAGQFVMDTGIKKNYVFFAAGSGITPIISQIKHLLFHGMADRVVLIFGNKNFGSIIFREEIENLKDKYLQNFSVHHIFSREKIGTPLHHGRIDKMKCDDITKRLLDINDVHEYYICGPNDMIFSIRESLESMGVEPSRIKFELFNTEGLKKTLVRPEVREEYIDKASDISIKMDGDIFEFSLDYAGQNLLDAAIENGADLPYSCKGGVCCTCKARVLQGKVEMDVNYALEKDEVEAGYVLLCQSHPRTEKVYIDFDQN